MYRTIYILYNLSRYLASPEGRQSIADGDLRNDPEAVFQEVKVLVRLEKTNHFKIPWSDRYQPFRQPPRWERVPYILRCSSLQIVHAGVSLRKSSTNGNKYWSAGNSSPFPPLLSSSQHSPLLLFINRVMTCRLLISSWPKSPSGHKNHLVAPMPNVDLVACRRNITKFLDVLQNGWRRIGQFEMQRMQDRVCFFLFILICIFTSHVCLYRTCRRLRRMSLANLSIQRTANQISSSLAMSKRPEGFGPKSRSIWYI